MADGLGDPVHILATWFHTLGFVIAWGYYGVLGRVILPGLAGALGRPAQVDALAAIERRALPLVLLSVVLFTVTGTWMLVVDPAYAGLGNVAASTWTVLMFAKHVLVVGMVVAGIAVHRLILRLEHPADDRTRAAILSRVRLSAELATGLGAGIALLTVAAQASVS
jgi:uncharacterized membrane protein